MLHLLLELTLFQSNDLKALMLKLNMDSVAVINRIKKVVNEFEKANWLYVDGIIHGNKKPFVLAYYSYTDIIAYFPESWNGDEINDCLSDQKLTKLSNHYYYIKAKGALVYYR